MDIRIKKFKNLELNELYELLRLRSEVFVVEQNCVYQDLDGKDQKAFHLLAYQNENLVGYTRIFTPGCYFKEASIGRVLVAEKSRNLGLGYQIMKASIEFINKELSETSIHISAQTYLKNFYNNLGFKEIGEEYLEDGIPHINMLKH
jgi:ElaA protein